MAAIERNKVSLEKGDLEYDIMNRFLYNYKNFIFFSKCTFIDDRDTLYTEVRYSYIGIGSIFIPSGSEYYK